MLSNKEKYLLYGGDYVTSHSLNIYRDKYLKYKNKYIKLKNQLGGATLEELEGKITIRKSLCANQETSFRQHQGECWNDSIQMLLCFSDALKYNILNKLLNLNPDEIIEMAYRENRERFLAPVYRRNDTIPGQNEKVDKMLKNLRIYLLLLQNRLCLHLGKEQKTGGIPICDAMSRFGDTCPIKTQFRKFMVKEKDDSELEIKPLDFFKFVFPTLSQEERLDIQTKIASGIQIEDVIKPYTTMSAQDKLEKQREEILGIASAMKGLKMINRKHRPGGKITLTKHGSLGNDEVAILNLLSFTLLRGNEGLITKKVKIQNMTLEDIDDNFGAIVYTPQHATSFYICDKIQIYYNDNYGMMYINWKNILKTYLEYKNTHVLVLYWTLVGYISFLKNKGNNTCMILDQDGNIINDNVDVNQFSIIDPDGNVTDSWEKGIIKELLFIRKENLKSLSEEEIYRKLEDQIIWNDIYNCTVSNIKPGMHFFDELTDLNICDKTFFYELVAKLNLSLLSTNQKDELIQALFSDNILEEDFRTIKIIFDTGVNVSDGFIERILDKIIYKDYVTPMDYKILQLLIDNGENINRINILKEALRKKDIQFFNFLIEKGADINKPYYMNENLLFYLFLFLNAEPIYSEFIKILVEKGINLNVRSGYSNKTILEISIDYLDLFKLLVINGIDVNENFSNGKSPLENILIFSGHIDSIDERTKQKLILLINAGAVLNKVIIERLAKISDLDIIQLLIKRFNVNDYIDENETLMTYIASKYRLEKTDLEIVRLLIENGADVNKPNKIGKTSLIIIVSMYDFNINIEGLIQILLVAGADVTATNKEDETVLEIARYNSKILELIETFISKKQ